MKAMKRPWSACISMDMASPSPRKGALLRYEWKCSKCLALRAMSSKELYFLVPSMFHRRATSAVSNTSPTRAMKDVATSATRARSSATADRKDGGQSSSSETSPSFMSSAESRPLVTAASVVREVPSSKVTVFAAPAPRLQTCVPRRAERRRSARPGIPVTVRMPVSVRAASNAARWSVSPVKTDRDRSSFISKEVGSKRG
mmetsp:Transcript_22788/g.57467  ORF Transcript_22788/g.57467 Transcript_22788/m.57467 type:complete len:201 (+) Transcript_22788:1509-2111(+)